MSEANGPASGAGARAQAVRPERSAAPEGRSAALPRPAGPGNEEKAGRLTYDRMSAHEAYAALRAQLWEHSQPAYTVGQAALLLCCSERHVWRQIAKGRIRTVHIGHRTLISRGVLEGLLAGDADAATGSTQQRLRVMT